MNVIKRSTNVVHNVGDYFLICLPLWVPMGFYLGFNMFPEKRDMLFLMGLWLFGETHFAATWLFFIDSNNWAWLKKRPVVNFWIPVFLVAFFLFLAWYRSVEAAMFLGSVLSAFHVTRQSIGLAKMYSFHDSRILNPALMGIYVCSLFYLGVGFFRFYSDIALSSELLGDINKIAIILPLLFMGYIFLLSKDIKEPRKFYAVSLMGMLLYGPYCFVEYIEYAIVMAVGVHWTQYNSLTIPLYLRKARREVKNGKRGWLAFLAGNPVKLVGYLILYGFVMIIFRQWGMDFSTLTFQSAHFSALAVIPLCFQVLHYYYEGFIWRFSDPHIRKEIGNFLFIPPSK